MSLSSSDGTILAVGATGNDGNGENSGHVRVYNLTCKFKIKRNIL